MDMDPIEAALAALKSQNIPNYTATAKKFGVNRTTLSRRHRGITAPRGATASSLALLSPAQKKVCIDYINELTKRGIPPTARMVARFAAEISGKQPGKNWVNRFVRSAKKELASIFLTGFDLVRKKADNIYQYERYFELVCDPLRPKFYTNISQVDAKIAQYKVLRQNIYNMDEKGFLIGVLQKTQRIYSVKELRKGLLKGAGQDGNREWITMIGTICMDGTPIPPAIIYQADSGDLQNTWLDEFDPKEHCCFFASSSTGWTNENLGLSWLTCVFDGSTRTKARFGNAYRLLFVDGHNSHINMRFLDWCHDNKILVAVYPPHSTHRLQPLDVSLYSPLSSYYSQELDTWIFKTGGLSSMTKRAFFGLFWPAYQRAFTEENILSGWRKTGLYPFNPALVLDQVRPEERPSSSTTGSSAISNPNWKQVRSLIRSVVQGEVGKEVRRLEKTVDALYVKNVALEARVANLKTTVNVEKAKRRRGKALMIRICEEGEVKAMFYSPNKLQAARQRLQEEQQEKDAAEAQKEEEKRRKQQVKEEKQLLIAQRKAAREETRIQREADKLQKQR